MIVINPNKIQKKIFLAGPIKGSSNWQDDVIKSFDAFHTNYIIANPRTKNTDDNFDLNKQISWETYQLHSADYIIFYIPKEDHKVENHDYAQTTRFELGENLARAKLNKNQKIFVCIEEGFPGRGYLKYKIENEYSDVAEWFEYLNGSCGLIKRLIDLDLMNS